MPQATGLTEAVDQETPTKSSRRKSTSKKPTTPIVLDGAGDMPEGMSLPEMPDPVQLGHSISQELEGAELDNRVLFLYDPSLGDRGQYSEVALSIPVQVAEGDPTKGTLTQFESLNIVPGLQRLEPEKAELILEQKSPALKEMIVRGVISIWNEGWDIRGMTIPRAQEAIKKTRSFQLLQDWAAHYHSLPGPIKQALIRRQEELQSSNSNGLNTFNNQVSKPQVSVLFGNQIA